MSGLMDDTRLRNMERLDGLFGDGRSLVKLGGFLEEFFKEAARGKFGPNAAGGRAVLQREKYLVLADGIEPRKIMAEPGLREFIEALETESAGCGVQIFDRAGPAAGGRLGEAEIDSAGDSEERLSLGLRDEAGAGGRKGGKIARVKEFGRGRLAAWWRGFSQHGFHVVTQIISPGPCFGELGPLPRATPATPAQA
jgi:hypothetical protein